MNYKFFPHTQDDVNQMLGKCGLKSLDELYRTSPRSCSSSVIMTCHAP